MYFPAMDFYSSLHSILGNISEILSNFLNSYDECIIFPNSACDYITLLQRKIYKPVKLSVMIAVCLALALILWPRRCFKKKENIQDRTVMTCRPRQPSRRRCSMKRKIISVVGTWLFLGFFIGFIVEYVRLYQLQKAKKMATLGKDKPPQCEPEAMTPLQKVWYFAWDLITWRKNECLEFYEALVVDPLWEITPPMVMMSLLTRTVVTPFHDLSMSLGLIVHNFMLYFPGLWQVPASLGVFVLTAFVVLLSCRYRISFPFVSVEPHSQTGSVIRH